MQAGDIFTLDHDAIIEMENNGYSVSYKKDGETLRLEPSMQFRVTAKGIKFLPNEVRASTIDPVTGKARKGRTRRFPAVEVYRLLGETPPVVTQPANDDVGADSSTEDESDQANAVVSQSPTPAPVLSDEENERIAARAAELLGATDVDDDW